MKVGSVKGLFVVTISLDQDDNARIMNSEESDVVAMAKEAVGRIISKDLINDILIGHEGEELHVAISV